MRWRLSAAPEKNRRGDRPTDDLASGGRRRRRRVDDLRRLLAQRRRGASLYLPFPRAGGVSSGGSSLTAARGAAAEGITYGPEECRERI